MLDKIMHISGIVISYLPYILLGLGIILGLLRGLIKGNRKSLHYLIRYIICLSLTCLTFFVFMKYEIYNQLFAQFKPQIENATSVTGDTIYEFGYNFLSNKVTNFNFDGVMPYVGLIVEVAIRIVLAIVCIVLYWVFRFLFWIFYLIFFSERRRKRKIKKAYKEGKRKTDYHKGILFGILYSTIKSVVAACLFLALFSSFFGLLSGNGHDLKLEEGEKVSFDTGSQVIDLTDLYNGLQSYNTNLVVQALNKIKVNERPLYMFIVDNVFKGKLTITDTSDEVKFDEDVYINDELATVVDLVYIAYEGGMVQKYMETKDIAKAFDLPTLSKMILKIFSSKFYSYMVPGVLVGTEIPFLEDAGLTKDKIYALDLESEITTLLDAVELFDKAYSINNIIGGVDNFDINDIDFDVLNETNADGKTNKQKMVDSFTSSEIMQTVIENLLPKYANENEEVKKYLVVPADIQFRDQYDASGNLVAEGETRKIFKILFDNIGLLSIFLDEEYRSNPIAALAEIDLAEAIDGLYDSKIVSCSLNKIIDTYLDPENENGLGKSMPIVIPVDAREGEVATGNIKKEEIIKLVDIVSILKDDIASDNPGESIKNHLLSLTEEDADTISKSLILRASLSKIFEDVDSGEGFINADDLGGVKIILPTSAYESGKDYFSATEVKNILTAISILTKDGVENIKDTILKLEDDPTSEYDINKIFASDVMYATISYAITSPEGILQSNLGTAEFEIVVPNVALDTNISVKNVRLKKRLAPTEPNTVTLAKREEIVNLLASIKSILGDGDFSNLSDTNSLFDKVQANKSSIFASKILECSFAKFFYNFTSSGDLAGTLFITTELKTSIENNSIKNDYEHCPWVGDNGELRNLLDAIEELNLNASNLNFNIDLVLDCDMNNIFKSKIVQFTLTRQIETKLANDTFNIVIPHISYESYSSAAGAENLLKKEEAISLQRSLKILAGPGGSVDGSFEMDYSIITDNTTTKEFDGVTKTNREWILSSKVLEATIIKEISTNVAVGGPLEGVLKVPASYISEANDIASLYETSKWIIQGENLGELRYLFNAIDAFGVDLGGDSQEFQADNVFSMDVSEVLKSESIWLTMSGRILANGAVKVPFAIKENYGDSATTVIDTTVVDETKINREEIVKMINVLKALGVSSMDNSNVGLDSLIIHDNNSGKDIIDETKLTSLLGSSIMRTIISDSLFIDTFKFPKKTYDANTEIYDPANASTPATKATIYSSDLANLLRAIVNSLGFASFDQSFNFESAIFSKDYSEAINNSLILQATISKTITNLSDKFKFIKNITLDHPSEEAGEMYLISKAEIIGLLDGFKALGFNDLSSFNVDIEQLKTISNLEDVLNNSSLMWNIISDAMISANPYYETMYSGHYNSYDTYLNSDVNKELHNDNVLDGTTIVLVDIDYIISLVNE